MFFVAEILLVFTSTYEIQHSSYVIPKFHLKAWSVASVPISHILFLV
jgi:hypothetical protein